MQRGDHDGPPGRVRSVPRRPDDRRSRARGRAAGRPGAGRPFAVGGDDHAVASASSSLQPVGEPFAVAHRRGPSPLAVTVGDVGASGVAVIVHTGAGSPASSRSRVGVQPGERRASSPTSHVLASARGQVGLLGQQVLGAVAHASRLDQQHLAVGRQQVGEQCSSSVSHGSQLSMPSKSWPSASRSHCSRPHGSRR